MILADILQRLAVVRLISQRFSETNLVENCLCLTDVVIRHKYKLVWEIGRRSARIVHVVHRKDERAAVIASAADDDVVPTSLCDRSCDGHGICFCSRVGKSDSFDAAGLEALYNFLSKDFLVSALAAEIPALFHRRRHCIGDDGI